MTLRDWGVDAFTVLKGYSLPEPIQLLDADRIHSQLIAERGGIARYRFNQSVFT